jgi:hypothetical protein
MKSGDEGGLQKVLIATVISVLLNPVGVGLGWYLSHVLERPKLQVEYVNPIYEVEMPAFDGGLMDSLRANRDVVSRLREVLARNNANTDCRRWLDGATWNGDCLAIVSDSARGVRDMSDAAANVLAANIKALEKWSPAKEMPDLEPVPGLEQISFNIFARHDKQMAISTMRGYQRTAQRSVEQLDPLIRELERIEKSEGTRTGKVHADNGILNAGASDGVVPPKATLIFRGNRVSLKATDDNGAPHYGVLKAHSFSSIRFYMDDLSGEKEAAAKLRDALVKSVQEDFGIEIPLSNRSMISGRGKFN